METHRPTMDDLKRMYERYEKARKFVAEFEEWLARDPGQEDKPVGGRFRDLGQREAVLEILEENPDEVYLTREIVRILTDGGMEFQTKTPVTSISSILSKAADEGLVERMGRGLWSIKDHTVEPDNDLPF